MTPRVTSKISYFDFNRDSLFKDERMQMLVIKATATTEGLNIFKTLLKSVVDSRINAALFCCDGPVEFVTHGIDINNDTTLVFDEFKNFYKWDENKTSDAYMNKMCNFEGFLFIFSLTSLIVQKGINDIYREFHKLLSDNPKLQIVGLVYDNVHSSRDIQILDNLATAIINVNPDEKENKFLLTMFTKNKAYGQIWYDYKLSSNFTFDHVTIAPQKNNKNTAKKPDPTKNLTFNLNLKEGEKEARSQLQMPFAKSSTNDAITTQDLEDDLFEEEDPDDDLGFLEAV